MAVAILGREPFSFTPEQVGRMTPHQVELLLAKRDDNGLPELDWLDRGDGDPAPSFRDMHDEWAFANKVPACESGRIWRERVKRGEVE